MNKKEKDIVDKMLSKSAIQRATEMKERLAQKAEKAVQEKADHAKQDQNSKKHISFSK